MSQHQIRLLAGACLIATLAAVFIVTIIQRGAM